MKNHIYRSDKAGFTMVELIIAVAVAAIVGIAIFSAQRLQIKTSAAQDSVSQMQQNIRAGLNIMIGDLRMAGYDKTDSGDFGFVDNHSFSNGSDTETVYSNGIQVAFTMNLDSDEGLDLATEDVNGDGRIDMSEQEQVSYRINNGNLERYSSTTAGTEWQEIAENIEAIEFYYTLEDGTKTLTPSSVAGTNELENIRSIQISILARAEQRDANYINNEEYTPASGTPWDLSGSVSDGTNVPGDQYRRRLLITTVECRNMGV